MSKNLSNTIYPKNKNILAYILILILFTNISLFSQQNKTYDELIKFHTNKFEEILRIVTKNYVDSVNIEKMSENAFKAMLNSLDNQSTYFDKQYFKSNKVAHTGKQIGSGLTIINYKDTSVIHSMVYKSTAYLKGLKPNDRIYKIDSIFIKGKSEFDINNLINGLENTSFKIGIFRYEQNNRQNNDNKNSQNLTENNSNQNDSLYYINNNYKYYEFDIERQLFSQSSILTSFQLDTTIYIKLNKFTTTSDRDIIDTLNTLKQNSFKRIIFDLRGNGGGYLDQVTNICALFLDSGDYVLKSRASNPNYNITKQIQKTGKYKDIRVDVLIDNESASGSEILAGVVQDYDLGIVYGERSFGKGTVQNTWEFKDETGFKLTVAEYLTPLERPINKSNSSVTYLDPALQLNMNEQNFAELNKLVNEFGNDKIKIYESRGGRNLIGGGGIFPDVFVKQDTTNILTQTFISKRILFEFIHNYYKDNKVKLLQFNTIEEFEKNFVITESMLTEFKRISYTYNIWSDKFFEQDKDIIITAIKARLAEIIYGQDAYYTIYNLNDKSLIKALEQ